MKSLHRKLHPAAFLLILVPFLATLALVFTNLQPNSTTEYRSQAAPVCRLHGEFCNASIYPCCAGLACSNSVCVGSTPTPRPSTNCAAGYQCYLKSSVACSNPINVAGSCTTTNGAIGSCCKAVPTSSPRPTATRTPTPTVGAPRSYVGQKCNKVGDYYCDAATNYAYYCTSNLALVRGDDRLCVKPVANTCYGYLANGAECSISGKCNSCSRCSNGFKVDKTSSIGWRCSMP